MKKILLIEDYKYVCNVLKQHPILVEKIKKFQFCKLCECLQSSVHDYDSLLDALTEVTMFFHDGHTNIELPYTTEDRCLKLPCRWEGERLVLCESYMDIPVDTEISAI